jgi:ParB family chromosome partitioning protein
VRSVVSVDPFRCRVWDLHDRLHEGITEESCKAEIESFLQHGQLVPALARRLHNDSNHDFELIYGARRLFIARHVKKPLLVEVSEMSDQDAIVAMDLENRHRKDISPYERGLSYARWLREGYFKSQEEIADALKISASQVSRLLKLARLPSIVVDAFGSETQICEGWGVDISAVLEDPKRRPAALQTARKIAATTPRPSARKVYRQLLASAAAGRKPRSVAHDTVVKSKNGIALFRIRQQLSDIALILPTDRVPPEVLERIRSVVTDMLEVSPEAECGREVA